MRLRNISVARLKRWLVPVGWTAVVLALGLVAQRLAQGGGAALLADHPQALWTVLPAMLLYGAACVLTTAAWWALLKPLGRSGIRFPSAHRIYALSQIGKYLPGNVMHFVGRAAMARTEGVPLARTGFTMVQEGVLMITAALSLSAALGGARWLGVPPVLTIPAVAATILSAVTVSSAPHIAQRLGFLRNNSFPLAREPGRLAWVAAALAGYALFFCLAGGIFLAILESLNASVPWSLAVAAVCAGWLLGFVTPGASAGIGVREAVLITALEPSAGPAAAAAALLFRLVTTGGDVVLFASGAALRRWGKAPSPPVSGQKSSWPPHTD